MPNPVVNVDGIAGRRDSDNVPALMLAASMTLLTVSGLSAVSELPMDAERLALFARPSEDTEPVMELLMLDAVAAVGAEMALPLTTIGAVPVYVPPPEPPLAGGAPRSSANAGAARRRRQVMSDK